MNARSLPRSTLLVLAAFPSLAQGSNVIGVAVTVDRIVTATLSVKNGEGGRLMVRA